MDEAIGGDALGIKKALIPPHLSVAEALRCLDEFGRKVAFVVDQDERLIGVVTDGDVRRWIIAGGDLGSPVEMIMTTDPVVLHVGFSPEEARDTLVSRGIDSVPVLDASERVVAVYWWCDALGPQPVRTAPLNVPLVVMAGGEGKRLSPYTRVLPKPLIPVGDVPIAELIIARFVEAGCSTVYLTVNYKANLVRAYFSDVDGDYDLEFIQEDSPLGTAGSLSLLRGRLDSTFFVSNCDILVDADYGDVLSFHKKHGYRITVVGSLRQFTIPYGVCEISAGGRLVAMSEKPSFSHVVSTGMYVIEPDVIDDMARGERCDTTELIGRYLHEEPGVGVYPISERSWLDMGQLEELAEMRSRLSGQGS